MQVMPTCLVPIPEDQVLYIRMPAVLRHEAVERAVY